MIITANKFITQYHFPKTVIPPSGVSAYTVDFYLNIDGKHFVFELSDEGNYSDFYTFNIDFDDFEDMEADREYNYVISARNKALEHGLIRIGNYVPPKTEYNATEEIIQYNG